jgi:hypothetical protein
MTDDAEVTHLLAVSEATARSRVKDESREAYNSKIKYCINFMRNVFPQEVELGDDGIERLKLPLSFNALSALFANIMTDTNLSRTAKKRKAEFDARVEEVDRVRQAMINRGITDEGELPAIPVEEEDTTINKARSITAAKTTVGGYKSALKKIVSGAINVYNTTLGEWEETLRIHDDCVVGLVPLSDGRIVTGSIDRSMKIISGLCTTDYVLK